jgi:hypothetical protein
MKVKKQGVGAYRNRVIGSKIAGIAVIADIARDRKSKAAQAYANLG